MPTLGATCYCVFAENWQSMTTSDLRIGTGGIMQGGLAIATAKTATTEGALNNPVHEFLHSKSDRIVPTIVSRLPFFAVG